MGKLPIRKISGYICFSLRRSVAKDQIVREQQRADSDARVCYVERGPMIAAGVQDDEIDHVAESKAIGQVSENTREQQRARTQNSIVVSRRAHEVIENCDGGEHRQHDEKPATKRTAFLQLTKSDAGILGVDKLKEAGNDDALVTKPQRPHRPRLRRLIGKVDAESSQ